LKKREKKACATRNGKRERGGKKRDFSAPKKKRFIFPSRPKKKE